MSRKICVAITARPSYSRVKSVLEALRSRRDVELQIIAAGAALVRNYGRVVDQIRKDGFEVSAEVPSVVQGDGTRESAISTGLLLTQLAGCLDRLTPDVVVTVADRHETLATATAASYQHIPLCHIQGGEISGSIDGKVRNAITQLADVHCVSTQRAAENVKAMAGAGAEVHLTGCPSIDLAREALKAGQIQGAQVVVLQHPVTDEVDHAAEQMRVTMEAVAGYDVAWFWPGEDAGSEVMSKVLRLAGVKPIRNKAPLEFLRFLLGSGVLVGNSSVGIRECSYLGVPVVDIGRRQEGRERAANVKWTEHRAGAIRAEVMTQIGRQYATSKLYGDGTAGRQIAGILATSELRRIA